MAKLPCPEELWPTFSMLLDAALAIPPPQRAEWLAGLGPEHAAVLPWIINVIDLDGGSAATADKHEFLESMPGIDLQDDGFAAGEQVGPYQLERRLGGGGMGEVWLASRSDGTLNRRVALKLPHAYLLASTLRKRFERERDILAGLSHPHIALLYDAGVDELGRPYLAMEWVDGTSLLEHCRAAKMPLERRLELFLDILDAVAYAHGRLVAHRDIKPSNILVTADDRAKLLDFGIAKLLTDDTASGVTQLTQIGTRLATPDYAAPEQLAGQPITVAVDIYALGVVLHELLTGWRPVRSIGRASAGIAPGHAAELGGLTAKQLRQRLSGDLDAIIAKALEAAPAQRYASAESFALDIRRSRENRPIAARRIGAATLALKYVRRHWLGVSMAAGLLLVIIAGSVGIAWQGLRAAREAERATTIKDFLIGVFRASDPRIAHGKPRGEITARELLDISSEAIDRKFANQPATQVELLGVAAEIYRELDETKRSTLLYRREAELARRYFGAADSHSIDGLLGQAYNADFAGDNARALELLDQADPLIHAAALDHSAPRARWLLIRGEILSADSNQRMAAQAALTAAVSLFGAVAAHDPSYADALVDLGAMALENSEFAQSADYYERAIAVARADENSNGVLLLANAGLAVALKDQGNFPGAARAFEAGTRVAERTYGRDSYSYWAISSDWARFRYERGERQALDAFESLSTTLPRDPAAYRNAVEVLEASQVLRKYGRCLAVDGQGERAIDLLERAQALLKVAPAHVSDSAHLLFDLGRAYAAGGRSADARTALAAARDVFADQHAPPSQQAIVHEGIGRFLLSQNEVAAAAAEFQQALALSGGDVTEASVYARAGLGAAAVARGDADAARQEVGLALEQVDKIQGSYDVRVRPYVWYVGAQALLLGGDSQSARQLARRALEADSSYFAVDSAAIVEVKALLRRIDKKAGGR